MRSQATGEERTEDRETETTPAARHSASLREECRSDAGVGGEKRDGESDEDGRTRKRTGRPRQLPFSSNPGGKLVLFPPRQSRFPADENIIVGNVALYGATSGKAFIAGLAGERFCVRNSGACAVVEGVGDHGCEYMTEGRVVILGQTGKNFAAGMSGGVAYVLDEAHDLYTRLNKTGLVMSTLKEPHDIQELEDLIRQHVEATGSVKGERILKNFGAYIPSFKKIIPRDYERMISSIAAFEGKGESREQAEIAAFFAAVGHGKGA